MPPLTLEQVLARSMRMSRSRVPTAVSKLFDQLNESAKLRHTALQTLFSKPPSTRFDQLAKNEDDEMSHRMSIHTSRGLVKNNIDLLAILRSSAKIGSWEDAVNAFVKTTGCELTPAKPLKATSSNDVYNVCLKSCEAEGNWQGALRIIRSMGANPLQNIDLEELLPQSREHASELNNEYEKELKETQKEVDVDKTA